MLSERDIELAHPEAFDFAFGNLPSAKRAEFNRHLTSCRHCQAVIDEYSEIGRIIKILPPHVDPPTDLEDRTVTGMVAALAEQRTETDRRSDAEDRAATRIYAIPEVHHPAEPETQVQPRPQLQPRAEDDTEVHPSPTDQPAPAEPEPPTQPTVTRLPVWRRYPRRLAAVVAAAAAVIAAAIVLPLSLITASQTAVAIPLYAAATAKTVGDGAASGQATARQDPSGSWNITLTVRGLRSFGDSPWYECWYIGSKSGHRQVAPVGSFLVSDTGSRTFHMTSGVDPRDFKTMEIVLRRPSSDGALRGTVVVLTGQANA
jgi:hypothetical protein